MIKKKLPAIFGIDYGKNYSRNTVVIIQKNGSMSVNQSQKNMDADKMIIELAETHKPAAIFLDAPLSLPGVYSSPGEFDDFFYRKCDRATQAMSPMFLGGLTARSMRLARTLNNMRIELFESYPAGIAKKLELKKLGYKQSVHNIPACLNVIEPFIQPAIEIQAFTTWHHVDALLTLVVASRYYDNIHQAYGNPEEGLIYI